MGIPRISVQLSYPNAAARTLETSVVAPLRNTLLQVNGLSEIESRTRDESAVIYLDFPFGTNPNLAFIEVNEKIDQAMNQLPRELERPRVLASDVSDIPVLQLAITLKDTSRTNAAELLELSELSRKVLRRRLEQIPEIAFADLSGQTEPQLVVRPRAGLLQSLDLTEQDLGNLLREANLDLGSLLLQDGYYEYNVRFDGQLRTAADLQELVLNVRGRSLSLAELAEVRLEARPPRGHFLHNGLPGVVFSIRKRADARLFNLGESLDSLLVDLEREYPSLLFSLDNDQTDILRASIRNLTGGLLYGAGFAILILFAFFREWKRPLLIGLAVPVALIIALLGFYLTGLSVNVISLAGLILGLGLMIDNSIIVLDNIQQLRQLGKEPLLAAQQGADEVIRPLLSSALTTVAVFLPLVLLSGVAGALFRDQAVAVSLALAASLVTAYLLLPLLSRNGKERKKATLPITPAKGRFWQLFDRSVVRCLSHPWLTFVATLLWLTVGGWLVLHLPTQGFPDLSRRDFQLSIDWNTPLSLTENKQRCETITDSWHRQFSGSSAAFVGEKQFLLVEENQATNAAELHFYLPEPTNQLDFAVGFLNQLSTTFPEAIFTFRPLPNLFDRIFSNDRPPLELRLRDAAGRESPEWELTAPLVEKLVKAGLRPEIPGQQDLLAIRLNYQQLQLSRVAADQLRQRLLTLFSENEVTRLRTNDRSLPVLIAQSAALDQEQLFAATVTNEDGNLVPLRYLLNVERQADYKTLTADRSGEYLRLAFDRQASSDQLTYLERIASNSSGLTFQLAGRQFTDQERIRELAIVLLVSLLLLYLILAAQFESLVLPLVVLLVVPVSLVGSVAVLYWTGASLNLLSLIGMVVTGGIVVNDAIIKVDMIQRARQLGLTVMEAIHEAGRRRLRAIVMTSLTTILALAPVIFTGGLGAELQTPLALTIMGGLSVGTLGSLYLIPWLYRALVR